MNSIEYFFNFNSLFRLEEAIKQCKDLNRKFHTPMGRSYLHIAAQRGENTMVRMLLDYGAAIDIGDYLGNSPLHLAASYDHHVTVQLLIDRGANVSKLDNQGNTPLHKTHGKKVAEILIRNGASSLVKNFSNQSALHTVNLLSRYVSLKEITEFFIDQGAEVDGLDRMGRSPLFCAAQRFQTEASLVLIKNGADINKQDDTGWTPLHGALRAMDKYNYSFPPVVELLLNHGASLNVQNHNGNTPFHQAVGVHCDNVALAKLLQSGVKLDVMNGDGCTALHMAALNGDSACLAELLAFGFSLHIKDNEGKTPYDHADVECQKFMARYIHLSTLANLPACKDVPYNPLSEEDRENAVHELERIKATKMSERFCLLDILSQIKRPYYLLDCVMKDIETFFESSDFHDRFPIYADILKGTFNRSKNSRNYLIRKATQSMISYTRKKCCQLTPDLVWEEVFKFLSLKDLNNIIDSGF